ncbi:hypothetical protein COV53_00730 [Candidatus Gottesmanbacteria bacterium CG11_big_fil_rev_8_21_14_0_20_37_11]|uniref:EamA family transporter n=4 Tax=Microgenomates group TaxID=1794810 RepID=A0A2M7RR26_9BACT|nr:MAG: hypothetical protein AUJ73_00695 [Candidatus Gottesmanbacteria bacterium CG1_02_37_22]PIP32477.1 MAG: hypothetical protein COX23_04395 [Candidatus Gottesmanbacteria bacterium CG23_combo_of_CG06-09_8_20_14_all_37_19]PIR08850.1 MAG: hypothetical protein COV53_00730 [Candidatus Gottesmanbacteria bacterium CG11_big_fil_rev_8_21_14_0_20_37_11]PIX74525.1 MAG: EamA family transporter [Candidatus Roizmanbacteria bacterium CG_4_10_14_3_um_filter_33_21]PIZ02535.1 MAG: EamA family transporter [Can
MPTWIIYALFSAISASFVAIFGKIGISSLDTTVATTVRAIIMAVFLMLTTVILGKTQHLSSISSRALFFIVLSGIAGAVSWLFYFFALSKGPASGVAALDRLSVVFVFTFSLLLLGEKFEFRSLFGVVLITVGAILMSVR